LVEAAVYPYDSHSGPFSKGNDSKAAIVDANSGSSKVTTFEKWA